MRSNFTWTALLLIAITYSEYHPLLLIALCVIIIIFVISLITSLARNNPWETRIRSGICAIAILAWCLLLYTNFKKDWLDIIFIEINSQTYVNCISDGVAFDTNKALSVCKKYEKWWRYGFTKAIAFDSSGQIILKHASRDPEWIRAALSLDRKAPFGIIGFTARRLTGNFYSVIFYNDLPQDLINQN